MKIVIFCGGYGTRFWPISRKSAPKQFVPFIGGKSFLQITYARFRKIYNPGEIFIATEENYLSFIRKQLPEVPKRNIILEPERKDLLAACGLATAIVNKYFPGEPVLISWAKHLISKESVFLNALAAAGDFAEKTGLIVSVDSKPSYPSIHNGWVKLGQTLGKENGFKIVSIEKHIEKPGLPTAKKLFKSGKWLINTGYRVWKTDKMLDYYRELQPKMYEGLEKIVEAWGTNKQQKVLREEYGKFKKDSVEYGIFEKLPGNVRATIAADMGWKDVGISWELFYRSLLSKKGTNVFKGDATIEVFESDGNLIIGPKGKIIAVIGIKNSIIIDTMDGLLVCDMNKSQEVKNLFSKLEKYYPEYVE